MTRIGALGVLSCFCLLDAVPTAGTLPGEETLFTEGCSAQSTRRQHRGGARKKPDQGTGDRPAQSSTLPDLPKDLEKIDGKITEIINRTRHGEVGGMVDVRLRHGRQVTLVRLAPATFLREESFSLKKGNELSITGYWMTTLEGKLFVAIQIRKGDRRLHLRDSPGKPVWKS